METPYPRAQVFRRPRRGYRSIRPQPSIRRGWGTVSACLSIASGWSLLEDALDEVAGSRHPTLTRSRHADRDAPRATRTGLWSRRTSCGL